KSNQLVLHLLEKGVPPDTIVGIMVERAVEMIIGMMGILKAGGAYLPIDPDCPQERINYMLNDSGTQILLTDSSNGITYEKSIVCVPDAINLLRCRAAAVPTMTHSPPPTHLLTHSPTHLCYIIYTSGSTGKPKGVLVEHRHVVANLFAFYREFEVTAKDTIIKLSPFSFDTSVEEILSLILKGGKIVIPPVDKLLDIQFLSDFIVKHDINIIDCTPLLLKEFNRLNRVGCVNIIISGGDVLKREYIDNFPVSGKIYNTYGPTETTVCATYYRYSEDTGSNIPIGKPIANYYIYILDKYDNPRPIGLPGELCIGGAGVTRGYLNNPGLTAEKFKRAVSPNDQCPKTNDRLYRSGDLGRWLSNGDIEFLGRIDRQVKIRGTRIELAEIEGRLAEYAGIKEVVVLPKKGEQGIKYLCAYIVSPHQYPVSQLRAYLLK
ncbi:MAG: amino acid adenylation domain-containing protein, partial [bacterium]|nr:amino acid adenylation domain-containing protein [bacterium]